MTRVKNGNIFIDFRNLDLFLKQIAAEVKWNQIKTNSGHVFQTFESSINDFVSTKEKVKNFSLGLERFL